MFDLNEAINEWRQEMAEREIGDGRTIEELESHLREEVANLAESKLSEEEAFLIAARRLGDSNGLAREFRKLHNTGEWARKIPWIGAGVLLSFIVPQLIITGEFLGGWLGLYMFGLEKETTLICLIYLVAPCVTLAAFALGISLILALFKLAVPLRSRPWTSFLIMLFLIFGIYLGSIGIHLAILQLHGMDKIDQIMGHIGPHVSRAVEKSAYAMYGQIVEGAPYWGWIMWYVLAAAMVSFSVIMFRRNRQRRCEHV